MIIKMEVMLNTNLTTCSSIIVGKNCEPGLAREPKVADTYTDAYYNN